jgi:uncharacterized protein Veg
MLTPVKGNNGPLKAKTKQQAIEERVPPHDLQAEAALLSALLVDDGADPKVRGRVTSGDFYSSAHAWIFEAAMAVGEKGPADVVLVASHLRENGRLPQVGGMEYLTQILNEAPRLANINRYMDVVRRHARERQLLVLGHHMVAELYALGGRHSGALMADLKQQLDLLDRELLQLEEGLTFLPHADLWSPDPETDLVVPALGLGPGPAMGIFGQGFVGKSIIAFAMGMAVALGKDVWNAYSCRRGRWVHLDYEQGRKRSKSLVQRLARAYGGWAIDELDACVGDGGRCAFDIAIYPDINLTTRRAEDAYVRALEGARICTMDALKGLTPGIDENSSEIREYVDMLGRVSERTGCMIVLIHHAGKTPQDGSRPRKEAGRGSSAIFDALQSVFVLSGKKGEPTTVSHEKDRALGQPVDDFGLRIEDVPTDDGNPRGALRVVHLDHQQLGRNGGSDGEKSFARKVETVFSAIQKAPGIAGVGALAQTLSMRRTDVSDAIATLIAASRIVETKPGGNARRLYVKGSEPKA